MRHSLAFKLPALVVAGVLLSAATGTALALVAGHNLLREQAIESTNRKLDGYLNGVEQYLDRARDTLALSAFPLSSNASAPQSLEAQQVVADNVLRISPMFEYIMLLNAAGRPKLLRPAPLERQKGMLSLAGHEWFREAATGRAFVGDLEVSLATGRTTVVVAVPLRDTGGRFVKM